MKTLLPTVLALALGLPAFAADGVKDSPYYPLQLGSAWNYRAGDSHFSLKVARYEKVGDLMTMCARVELVRDGKVEGFEDVAAGADGMCRYAFENKQAKIPVCFLRLPPKKGESWTIDTTIGTDPLKGTLKSGEEEVKVPAGTYTCVTTSCDDLDANGIKISFTYYFAKDVGMVKQVIEAAGQKVVIELEKYEPGKAEK